MTESVSPLRKDPHHRVRNDMLWPDIVMQLRKDTFLSPERQVAWIQITQEGQKVFAELLSKGGMIDSTGVVRIGLDGIVLQPGFTPHPIGWFRLGKKTFQDWEKLGLPHGAQITLVQPGAIDTLGWKDRNIYMKVGQQWTLFPHKPNGFADYFQRQIREKGGPGRNVLSAHHLATRTIQSLAKPIPIHELI